MKVEHYGYACEVFGLTFNTSPGWITHMNIDDLRVYERGGFCLVNAGQHDLRGCSCWERFDTEEKAREFLKYLKQTEILFV